MRGVGGDGGHVAELVRIRLAVVQLLLARLRVDHVGVAVGANPLVGPVPLVRREHAPEEGGQGLDLERPLRAQLRVADRREQRHPVHLAAGLGAGRGQQGRREVDVRHLAVHRLARRHPRSSQDQRHAQRLLVGEVLVPGDPVLALQPAVVGEEHDQRVLQLVRLAQDSHELLHVVVHGQQRAGPALVVELQLVDLLGGQRGCLRRHVGRLVREVLLVEAGRLGQLVALALLRVARRRARVGSLAAHQRGGHVLAVRRGRGPPDEEGLLGLLLAANEILGDLSGHVGGVVLGLLRSPVACTGRGRRCPSACRALR